MTCWNGPEKFWKRFFLYSSLQKQPSEVFCRKGVLRNVAKFTGKHLCQSLLFNKVAGLRPATLLKTRDSGTDDFSTNFVKFLRTPFPTEHLRWLLLLFLIYSWHIPQRLIAQAQEIEIISFQNIDKKWYKRSFQNHFLAKLLKVKHGRSENCLNMVLNDKVG